MIDPLAHPRTVPIQGVCRRSLGGTHARSNAEDLGPRPECRICGSDIQRIGGVYGIQFRGPLCLVEKS